MQSSCQYLSSLTVLMLKVYLFRWFNMGEGSEFSAEIKRLFKEWSAWLKSIQKMFLYL